MKAIILAAGKSTRTYPLTLTRPKPLLPLLDGTVMDYTLDLLKEVGFDEVILIVNYKKEMIREKYGDEYKGLRLTYVEQYEPKGTGHAILCTKEYLDDENFLVLMGDDIYAKETIENVMQKNPSLAVREVKTPRLYGIYEVEEKDGELIAKTIEEKPEEPKSNLANLGLYYFETSFFDHLEKITTSPRGELEVTDAIATYLLEKDIRVVKAEPYWLPIGHPWDLITATERLIPGQNIIDDSAEIDESVEMRCCSVIGKKVKIGKNTKIIDSVIFDGAEIGENCTIDSSVIGEGVTIEDNVKIEADSNIESEVNGKTVRVNRRFGSAIGDKATVKKGAEIKPGVKIWPGKEVEGEVKRDVIAK